MSGQLPFVIEAVRINNDNLPPLVRVALFICLLGWLESSLEIQNQERERIRAHMNLVLPNYK